MDWVGGTPFHVGESNLGGWCFHVLTSTDENRPDENRPALLRYAIFVRVGTVLILRTESTVKVYGGF